VVLEQKPILLNALDPGSQTYEDLKLEHDYASAVLAPVIRNQRGIGYLFCDRGKDDEPFDDSDLLHLQVIGYLVGQLIEKFFLIQAGKKLSQIDDASKALQYKAFIPALATELERCREHEYAVTLALLSVDAFRRYIDTYGIDEAHALLAEIVAVIRKDVRDMDILARFGADEFILCLSGTDENEGREKLTSIQRSVSESVVGQGDAAIDLVIGALVLPDASATHRPVQEILSGLGKKLMEAKSGKMDDVVIGPLPPPGE
jgi:diguanylate cyclase (GGDEF)-like protein